jgi:hypothetical protein
VEQRKHQRYPVNYQGIFSNATLPGEAGVVQDLSVGGCRLGSPIFMAVDTAIHLQIRPLRAAPIYIPTAVVRWIRGSAFGLQFQEVAPHETRALTRLLWSLRPASKDGPSDHRTETP